MKEYTILDTSGGAIAAGGTESGSTVLDNTGRNMNYSVVVKGDIASADVDIDIEIPNDTEVYDTTLKGQNQLAGMDLTNGGEVRSTAEQPELATLRFASDAHITVTNNDGTAGDATVKIIQYEET